MPVSNLGGRPFAPTFSTSGARVLLLASSRWHKLMSFFSCSSNGPVSGGIHPRPFISAVDERLFQYLPVQVPRNSSSDYARYLVSIQASKCGRG